MLNELNNLPEGLLEANTQDLFALLGKPTLIHLDGKNPAPLFISTLLHGNETTGFYALQEILKQYSQSPLPRSLSIFIGNVAAAAQNQRHLDTQPDYNRVWPGTHSSDSSETDMMKNVVRIMQKRKPFASIDIHNNTGRNPHYACVNTLNPHALQLANLFSTTTVYFTNPKGVQSSAFSDFCPAVVLECGQSGDAEGLSHTCDFIERLLNLDMIPQGNPENLNLYHTIARVSIPAHVSFGTEPDNDICLLEELESKNFKTLAKDSIFALSPDNKLLLDVINESSGDVATEFFEVAEQKIRLKRDITLSMYTTNTRAISQDCLCYFMDKILII